jgi:hypothetical protein
MDINEARKTIEVFFKSDNTIFSAAETDILKNCFYMMMYHINLLENESELEENITNILVNSAMLLVNDKILNSGLTPFFRKFIEAYSNIVYNWNKNISKDKNIELLCLLDGTILKLYNESASAAQIMRDVHQHYMDMRNWMPPAFSISKAYLDTLLNTNDEEESVEDDNFVQEA